MTDCYFGDVIGSYANGLQLDLRVKLAVDFLKSPLAAAVLDLSVEPTPKLAATFALDLATELMDLAQARGLTAPMPDSDELSGPMRKHIRRQVRAQVVGQIASQQIGADEQPKFQVPPGAANGLARQ